MFFAPKLLRFRVKIKLPPPPRSISKKKTIISRWSAWINETYRTISGRVPGYTNLIKMSSSKRKSQRNILVNETKKEY